MSDWHQVILDIEAGPDEASFLALKVITRLTTAGIIEPSNETDLNGEGTGLFKPGRNFAIACNGEGRTHTHDLSNVGGMETQAGPWVNMFGLASLETANCPVCATQFATGLATDITQMREGFNEASRLFCAGQSQPKVRCPVCFGDVPAKDWQTTPHLGYCNLAFIFWNWPPFNEWEIDIPRLISEALKHKTVVTYGSH